MPPHVYTNAAEMDDLFHQIEREGAITNTECASAICRTLHEGDFVVKSVDCTTAADDLFLFLDDVVGVGAVSCSGTLSMQELQRYFDTTKPTYFFLQQRCIGVKKAVPFSQILRDRVGQCLEMAVAKQLYAQRQGQEVLMMMGTSSRSRPFETHAWNLVKLNGVWWVFDAALDIHAPVAYMTIEGGRLTLQPGQNIPGFELPTYTVGGV